MAAPKRKTKSANQQNKYTAELSSGQLVIGVGILLVFGLACFLFGVLIGKFDPTLQPTTAQSNDQPVQTAANTPAETTPTKTDAQATPRQLPPELRAPTKTIATPRKEASSEPVKPKVETSKSVPTSARTSQSTADPKESEPKVTPQKAVETTQVAARPASPSIPKQALPASAQTVVPSKNSWYLQIAAFKVKANAEKERQRLQQKMPYAVSLLSTSDSNYIKVIIGEFPDRAAAEKVMNELKSRYGLKEALIKQKTN